MILVVLLIGMLTSSVFAASTVTVLGVWTGAEAEAFQKMMAPFEAKTGIKVEFTGTRDLSAILTTRSKLVIHPMCQLYQIQGR